MSIAIRSLSAVLLFTAAAMPGFAQDAMAPDPMAGDAMSAGDVALCLEQAAAITFPTAAQAATDACNGVHGGAAGGDAMSPDAVGSDAMGSDAMAPQQ